MVTFVINIEQASGCHFENPPPTLYFYMTTHTQAQYLAVGKVGVRWAWRTVAHAIDLKCT